MPSLVVLTRDTQKWPMGPMEMDDHQPKFWRKLSISQVFLSLIESRSSQLDGMVQMIKKNMLRKRPYFGVKPVNRESKNLK